MAFSNSYRHPYLLKSIMPDLTFLISLFRNNVFKSKRNSYLYPYVIVHNSYSSTLVANKDSNNYNNKCNLKPKIRTPGWHLCSDSIICPDLSQALISYRNISEATIFKPSPPETTTYVSKVLSACQKQLHEEGIGESRLHAEYIVSHALGVNRAELNQLMNKSIPPDSLDHIRKMMNCRLARMPLQYIFGDWEFHSIKLKVRPPVFIPRQETEGLVNIAIRNLKEIKHPLVLDIGCGSGAISLTLLSHFPQLTCVAVDHSKYATQLTLENAQDLNVIDRLHVVQGKVTEESCPPLPFEKFDCIVSNPPYVLRKDLIDLQPEITLYEDLRALDGGKEGLDVIQRIIVHSQTLLHDKGCLLMEIDPCHRYLIPIWMEKNKTNMKISQFYKDISGVHRYVKLIKKNNI